MAQLLYEKHSCKTHLETTRRHMRLCKQVKGCEKYATNMEPTYSDLTEKQKATELAKQNKQSAYDDVILCDSGLDGSTRTLYEKSKQYDRENPGRPVLMQLFTDGKLSTIIYAPLDSEPAIASQLLTRLESLGTGHALYAEGQAIKTNIDKCNTALSAYKNTIGLLKTAEAAEDISKFNLRRQYEFNYLDMVKEFGKNNADRLFPEINSKGKSKENGAGTGESPETKTDKP